MKLKNNKKKNWKRRSQSKRYKIQHSTTVYNKISDAKIKNEMTQNLKLRSTNFEIKKNKRS